MNKNENKYIYASLIFLFNTWLADSIDNSNFLSTIISSASLLDNFLRISVFVLKGTIPKVCCIVSKNERERENVWYALMKMYLNYKKNLHSVFKKREEEKDNK